jgi:hypothetical protein
VFAAFVDQPTAPRRQANLHFPSSGDVPRGNTIAVTITARGYQPSSGQYNQDVPYYGGVSAGWVCDAPPESPTIDAMTCTITPTGATVPTLSFLMAGYTPRVTATIVASENVDPDSSNDSATAPVPPWDYEPPTD